MLKLPLKDKGEVEIVGMIACLANEISVIAAVEAVLSALAFIQIQQIIQNILSGM